MKKKVSGGKRVVAVIRHGRNALLVPVRNMKCSATVPEMRVFVGDPMYASVGWWEELPSDKDTDEIMEEMAKFVAEEISPDHNTDGEFILADWEGIGSGDYTYAGFDAVNEKAQEIADALEDNYMPDELVEALIDYYGLDYAIDVIKEEPWYIEADSDEDLAYKIIDELYGGDVTELGSDTLEMYFDYAAYGRDLAINDFTEIGGYYVSRASRKASKRVPRCVVSGRRWR